MADFASPADSSFHLSLKDMSHIPYLPQLASAGEQVHNQVHLRNGDARKLFGTRELETECQSRYPLQLFHRTPVRLSAPV